jgi:transforming growth factor-beta-induced protein
MTRLTLFAVAILALALLFVYQAGPAGAAAPEPVASPTLATTTESAPSDIASILANDGRFNLLSQIEQQAGVMDLLKVAGPFTVLAPTDEAFASVPTETVKSMIVKDVFMYHIVPGEVKAADLAGLNELPTLLGDPLTVTHEAGAIQIGGVPVTTTEIVASNGIIQVMNAVLVPPTHQIVASTDLSTTLASSDQFKTFRAMLTADKQLIDVLETLYPISIFAPTDAAFAKLPATAMESLKDPKTFRTMALYHIIFGQFGSGDLKKMQVVLSLLGGPLAVSVEGDQVKINKTGILGPAISSASGTVFPMDTVFMAQ